MRQRQVGVNPFQAVFGQRQRLPERRRHGHWVNRRADIVNESRQGQRRGSRSAADGVGGLHDENGPPPLRDRDGRGEPVRPGPDDDGVIGFAHGEGIGERAERGERSEWLKILAFRGESKRPLTRRGAAPLRFRVWRRPRPHDNGRGYWGNTRGVPPPRWGRGGAWLFRIGFFYCKGPPLPQRIWGRGRRQTRQRRRVG